MTQESKSLAIALVADPTEPHVQGWTRSFRELGHDIRVIVPEGVAPELRSCAGAPILRMSPLNSRSQLARYVAAIRQIRSFAASADVVHGHYLYPYGWLAGASGRPYAVTVWGSDLYRGLHRSAKDRAAGWLALKRAGIVTADSEGLAEAAIAAGARRDRVRVLQFGVDLEQFHPGDANELRRELNLVGSRVIFSARSPTPLYRHDLVVEAVRDFPGGTVLLISAHRAEPGYLEHLRRLAMSLGVADRIRIIDDIPHDRMPEYYRLADAIVTVPASDATPMTLLEAFASGTPVVAGALPSIREWAQAIHPALLLDNPSPHSISDAVGRALSLDSEALLDLQRRGREVVVARGERHANMREMERLYRALAKPRALLSTLGTRG